MSTVSEVCLAAHCGMKVAAISVVVNLASGLSEKHITHDETLHYTGQAADRIANILEGYAENHAQ